jgi:hypothetical protein
MTSISIPREGFFGRESEEFDATAASPTASHEPHTGRTPTAWATSRDDESQSATFRALAWSQEDDAADEYLPWIGEEYTVSKEYTASEVDSHEAVQFAEDAAGSVSAPRFSRSALLYGIIAGFAAASVGGLLLTVVNADIAPPTTSPTVIQPAENVVVSQPNGESAHQAGPIRPFAPAPTNAVASSTRPVPPAAISAPSAPALPPASQLPSAPQASAPEVTAPEVTTPQVKPQVLVVPPELPPVVTSPIVSVPEVTPQPVPHPVGPIVIHVPAVSDPTHLPTPSGPIHMPTVFDPAIPEPAAPAASNPGISLKPGVTIPVVIPTLSTGAGQ